MSKRTPRATKQAAWDTVCDAKTAREAGAAAGADNYDALLEAEDAAVANYRVVLDEVNRVSDERDGWLEQASEAAANGNADYARYARQRAKAMTA